MEILSRKPDGSVFPAGISARHRTGLTLRMAPMIDMIFLLLIFFLVSARWRPQEDFLPFKLPTAQPGRVQLARPEPLQIKISATNSGCTVQISKFAPVWLDRKTIKEDLTLLLEKTKAHLIEQKRFADDPVEIVCGPDVRWEHLAQVYNVFYGVGMTDITFTMTERQK